ncbi:glycosyltransferase [Quadrisphaera setariae]|uniref:Glycosyltransferase family 4 protein n=1 Tax=Quadrisphaera setariae TaxID=2593304 RepID=A0A5C8ZJH6_9ACTN|nr:glycosyltransferase [Quadrisphaera setariae]TXR58042.1 glycosyltransferase family 4 protein [Quadrisphaera setariae]
MRTVVVTRAYAPEPAAAAWRQAALARALAGAGHAVEVLTSRPPAGTAPAAAPPGDDDAGPSPRVRRWPVLRDASGNVRGYVQYASFDLPAGLRLAARVLGPRAGRPDVVVVEPPPTTGLVVRLVCGLRRVPYAYYAADLLSLAAAEAGLPGPALRLLTALEAWVLRGAARVMTVDEGYAARVRALGVPAERVVVVGTGVDTDQLRPPDPSPGAVDDDGADDQPPAFVYAGTMSEVQGAGVLVDALARVLPEHPGARAVFYGGGVQAGELAERAARLAPGLIAFPGLVAPSVIARATATARAGLASQRPDTAYAFAFLVKPLAATACGAPVVYAGAGPFAQLVGEHRLGWAVPWDVDAVAAALREALERPAPTGQERARLVAWTREHHSLRSVARRAAAVVEAAVSPPSRS